MRSDKIKKGLERMPNRALLYGAGLSPSHINRPFIGIASSYTDLIPGHINMRALERYIERGVENGGGTPFLFGVPGICDGIAMGHQGMKQSLPSRELIADVIESVASAHALDGLILLTNCDKITPGMIMGALRINIPTIVVTAGPMLGGHFGKKRLSLVRDTFEAVGRFKAGQISEGERSALEIEACPGCGSCQGLYTANTMACLTEGMGLSLPYCAATPAVLNKKIRIAYESGQRIVDLVKKNIKPKDIVNKKSLESLIKSGCFDNLAERNQLLFNLERLLEASRETQRAKLEGQRGLFDGASQTVRFQLVQTKPASKNEKLRWEKELLGLFVTSHPIKDFKKVLEKKVLPLSRITQDLTGKIVKIGGVISSIKKIITKTGKPMFFTQVEDEDNKVEVVVFPGIIERNHEMFQENKIIMVKGRVDNRDGVPKIICEEVEELCSSSSSVEEITETKES